MTTALTLHGDDLDRRFALGDDGALRAAFEQFGSLVHSFCRRTLDESLAEEATQDVFVSAWRGRERFDPDRGSLAAWLIGIAKHRVIDRVRAERRHTDRAVAADTEWLGAVGTVDGAGTPAAVDPIERLGDRMLVAEALARLDDRPRTVIELAYLGGMSHGEIADETGIPVGTVKSDIRRGLERIRRFLETSDA